MASPAQSGFPARTNSRLDAFLRRHLAPKDYDAIRAYESCIVVSNWENHTFKYVVLSDRLIYLTENPPKSIRRAVALRDVVAIELLPGAETCDKTQLINTEPRFLRRGIVIYLIDDYPEFLNSPDRESNQHIRIIYSSTVKEYGKSKGIGKLLFPFHHASANNKKVTEENNGPNFWKSNELGSLNEYSLRCRPESSTQSKGSTVGRPSNFKESSLHGQGAFRPLPSPSRRSCQSTPATDKTISRTSCTTDTKETQDLAAHKGYLSEIPYKCNGNGNEFYLENSFLSSTFQSSKNLKKRDLELHLYIISTTSSIFLHLKSSWNNYNIKATLLQDPLYASELGPTAGSEKPYRSEEKIKHFSQLKSELFLKDNSLSKTLCLIMELKVAAQKNFILKRLFWKTSDLFYFLVNKLQEYLPESREKNAHDNKSQRADELAACIEILQTLGQMFRETETESSRLNTLAAKKGTLFNLLVILISKPQIPKSCPEYDVQSANLTSVLMPFDAELQKLILKYTDTATALLYEILLVFQQGNLGLGSAKFAISWMMSLLQNCPSVLPFVSSIVKQVVKGLSASFQLLSPCQAVLLYQQFYILKSCLQYSKTLAEYIRNDYREEFRYFIHMSALEKRLPLYYPITQTTTQLFHEVLKLIEQKPCEKC